MAISKRLAGAITAGVLIGGVAFGGIAIAVSNGNSPAANTQKADAQPSENDLVEAKETLAEETSAEEASEAQAQRTEAKKSPDAADDAKDGDAAEGSEKATGEKAEKKSEGNAAKKSDEPQSSAGTTQQSTSKPKAQRGATCDAAEGKSAVAAAQKKLDNARAAQNSHQVAVGAAQKSAQQAIKDEKLGTAGFFRWLGAQKNDADANRAYQLLTTGGYTDAKGKKHNFNNKTDQAGKFLAKTELNKPGDATTLKNLKATLRHIDRGNALRSSDEVFPGGGSLKINSLLMAGSQVQTNASHAHMGHRGHIVPAENLSWGSSDPFKGWYSKEKELYKKNKKAAFHDVGHYLNLTDRRYTVTGFAVVDKPGTTYRIAHGQVFDTKNYMNADRNAPSYTTGEYAALISAYENYLVSGKGKVAEAQKALSAAQADVAAAEKSLKAAKAAASKDC